MKTYNLNYLKKLEAEAIYIFREAVSQCKTTVLLFSGGKDSIVLTRLAEKAFWPLPIPFPLLHIDTGHNFPETIAFRDRLAADLNVELLVRYVQDSINKGTAVEEKTKNPSRNKLQSITLMDAFSDTAMEDRKKQGYF
jgi:sulfate adenylyltransferase subunit 2